MGIMGYIFILRTGKNKWQKFVFFFAPSTHLLYLFEDRDRSKGAFTGQLELIASATEDPKHGKYVECWFFCQFTLNNLRKPKNYPFIFESITL